jgi:uncharacterized protein YcbX
VTADLKLVVDNKITKSKFYDDERIQLECENGVLDNVLVNWNVSYSNDEPFVEIEKIKIGDLELTGDQIIEMCGKTHVHFLEQEKIEQLEEAEKW